jgi:hypothetical protein
MILKDYTMTEVGQYSYLLQGLEKQELECSMLAMLDNINRNGRHILLIACPYRAIAVNFFEKQQDLALVNFL